MSNTDRVEKKLSSEELAIQKTYIEKIKEINVEFEKTNTRKKMFCVKTYGCQMNSHDSEKLIGILIDMGYIQTEEEKKADLIIYNTCCVRENAENKVYGNLGFLKSLKKENKDLKIVLCGCMMQQDAVIDTIKKSYRHVDVIFGTYNIYEFPQLLHTSLETNELIINVWESHGEIVEDLPTKREFSYKAGVNIMFGCNNFCTYCIVPYVRGRERSRASEDIVNEVKELVKDGVVEVTLLGQNVNSYGSGLDEDITFAGLLRKVNEIDGLERIRFMTSHPKDISDDLIFTMAKCDKVCNHLHLPVQSGSSAVLKKMNRGYTKEQYLKIIDKVKSEIKDVTLTTDIIVGFPSETEEQFLETVELMKEVKYTTSFTFQYSKRTGTPAANMEEHIEESVVTDRFNRLLEVINPISNELNQKLVGKTLKVLVEGVSKNDKTLVTGRTEGFNLVHFNGSEDLIGKIVDVDIVDNKTFYLIGKLN